MNRNRRPKMTARTIRDSEYDRSPFDDGDIPKARMTGWEDENTNTDADDGEDARARLMYALDDWDVN